MMKQMIGRVWVALLLAILIAMLTITAAWAPKRYIAPSNGHPAQVSQKGPPIRGGG
jgi:hypothetical protein